MATREALQSITSEAVSFLEFMGASLEDSRLTDAIVRDLGGDPSKIQSRGGSPYPPGAMDSVKAYRDAADPKTESGYQVLTDLGVLIESVYSLIETWYREGATGEQGADEFAHALLDLLATNFWRLRHPRTFLIFQALALFEDLGATYGNSSNNLFRLGDALAALGGFLWDPVRMLGKLDPDPGASENALALTGDLLFRLSAGLLAFLDRDEDHTVPILSEVYSGWDAVGTSVGEGATRPVDLISERMSSFALDYGDEVAGGAAGGRLLITTAMIPKSQGGTAVFLGLGGSVHAEFNAGDWQTAFKVASGAGVAFQLGKGWDVVGDLEGFSISGSLGSRIPQPSAEDPGRNSVFLSVPASKGTRLDLGQVVFSIEADKAGLAILLRLHDAALVVEAGDQDGFIASHLKDTHLRLPFDLVIGHSTSGFIHEITLARPEAAPKPQTSALARTTGAGSIIDLNLPISRKIGALTIHEVALRIAHGPAGAAADAQSRLTVGLVTAFSTQIGPLFARIDQLGLAVTSDSAAARPNLGIIDLSLELAAPRSIALDLETAFVSGGGAITHDPDKGLYFGIIDLTVRGGLMVKAVALINTTDQGYSILLLVTVEFDRPYPLGMGFFLEGVGGLFGFHRTFGEAQVRAALPTGQLRNALFPTDPIRHAGEVQKALDLLFPAQTGSHLVGLLVKIGWAQPALIHMELGVIYEWGRQNRLILLGRVSAQLPRPDEALLSLNMDAVGVLDFDAGTFALDAVLYDSKLCGRFVLSGAMAMRLALKGSTGFALAVGGLHPRFNAPAGFPSVARLQLALTSGDNPKLICQSYFAITSNTIQFGSEASLYASALGFSVDGHVGFDVLIQLIPFHFLAAFRASVQLKRGSHNLFKVSLSGELEGPLPLRIAGKASFEILWCDFSVSFNRTLIGGEPKDAVIRVDALDLLIKALGAPRAWEAVPPPQTGQMATTRPDGGEGVLLHPLGGLSVKQTVVPLALDRDIDRIGEARPSGERRFAITHAMLGTQTVPLDATTRVEDQFASGQYFDMSDDERLAAPSFEAMAAGVRLSADGYAGAVSHRATSTFEYLDIVINADGSTTEQAEPHRPQPIEIWLMTQLSAAARAPARRGGARRFEAPVLAGAPKVVHAAVAPAEAATPPPPTPPGAPPALPPAAATGPLTWIEAQGLARGRTRGALAPRWELAS